MNKKRESDAMRYSIPDKVRGFLFSPSETYWKVKDESLRDTLLYFSLISLVYSTLSTIMTAAGVFIHPFIALFGLGFGTGMLLAKFLTVMVFSWLLGGLFVLLLHFWVFLLGGRKKIDQTVLVVFYQLTPFMLIAWIPDIGPLVGTLWTLVVGVIGIEELHQFSRLRAAAAVILAILTGLIFLPVLFRTLLIQVISTGPRLIGQRP
jgi:hypothetical protein